MQLCHCSFVRMQLCHCSFYNCVSFRHVYDALLVYVCWWWMRCCLCRLDIHQHHNRKCLLGISSMIIFRFIQIVWIKWKLKEFQITWANILFTKEHRFYAQNELISNLMAPTGFKIVGTGTCLPWFSISSYFQNILKTSGHQGYVFRCSEFDPILPNIGFQLLKSLWSSLTYFSFNDAPNVLYRWKIWTAGRPIQHPDSSTTKTCCCNSCSMWFCIFLLK